MPTNPQQSPLLVTCPRCRAEVEPLPILYGELTFEAYQEAKARGIPIGGCMVEPESPEFACPECQAALPLVFEPQPRLRRRTVSPMDVDSDS